MMNYIWGGLIVFSLLFALFQDGADVASDRFANGTALPVTLEAMPEWEELTAADGDRQATIQVKVDTAAFTSMYQTPTEQTEAATTVFAESIEAKLSVTGEAGQEKFYVLLGDGADYPEPWPTIAKYTDPDESGRLLAQVVWLDELGELAKLDSGAVDLSASAHLIFSKVRFRTLQDITQAAFDMAEFAAKFSLGLIGVLALWLGLLKIAEASGLIDTFVKVVQPLLHPLFPEVPKGHPALGMIALNMAANLLALGNAATPLGLKAMEELQTLNRSEDTATNSMCMLLAVNTASVTLMPSVTVIAVMGFGATEIIIPTIIVTTFSLIIAVFAAKSLQRLPVFVNNDPMLIEEEANSTETVEDSETNSDSKGGE